MSETAFLQYLKRVNVLGARLKSAPEKRKKHLEINCIELRGRWLQLVIKNRKSSQTTLNGSIKVSIS